MALLAPAAAGAEPATAAPVTQADLLRRMIDVGRLAAPPPAGEYTGMFSSFDRRSKIDADGRTVDWDANNDWGQFIRRDADGWDVMAEMKGPGAIVRIWSANPSGDLRILLDGEAVVDAPFNVFMSGTLPPFEEPFVYRGLNCYFPLGYSESCQVLCRNTACYYQVNYVQFPAGTAVQRFAFELDDTARAALADVKQVLEQGFVEKQLFGGRKLMPVAEQRDIGPGEKLRFEMEGAGTVRALYVGLTDRVGPRDLYALHRCVIRVFSDGRETPDVEAPLVDFFGSGFDLVSFRSLPIGTDKPSTEIALPLPDRPAGHDRFMYCYFPLPYMHGLTVEIENQNETKKTIGLLLHMRVDTRPPEKDALRFRAKWRKEDPCQVFDYPILETTGPGRIVGCVLNVDCPRAMWWGEGDEKVWRDGERFPSYFGTGSEDYLGDAWGLHEHIRPLQGVTRTGPYGKNSAYRWHIPDVINFQTSVRFTIENWQFGGFKDTYYGTVAYWYAPPDAQDFFKRLSAKDLAVPPLRIPGAIEIEEAMTAGDWGSLMRQRGPADFELSGGSAANITTEKPVAIRIPSGAERAARLKVRIHPRRSFETVKVSTPEGRLIGTVAYDRAAEGMYTVGIVRLKKGSNEVLVECARPTVLDCWVLEDLPRNGRGPEGEDLKVLDAGKGKAVAEWATMDWSAGGQLALEFGGSGDMIKLELPERKSEPNCPPEGCPHVLRLVVTAGPEGGLFQTLLDEKPVGVPFNARADKPEIRRIAVGAVTLAAGAHTLGVRAVGEKAGGAPQRLGLDVVELPRAFSKYALECEDLPIAAEERSAHTGQGIGGASGEEHLWCRPAAPGAWVELEAPVRAGGRYQASVVYTGSFDYGIVQAYVNGRKVGELVDTFAPAITPGLVAPLGTLELPAGPARFRFEVIGKADRSPGYYFGVDCIVLAPE